MFKEDKFVYNLSSPSSYLGNFQLPSFVEEQIQIDVNRIASKSIEQDIFSMAVSKTN